MIDEKSSNMELKEEDQENILSPKNTTDSNNNSTIKTSNPNRVSSSSRIAEKYGLRPRTIIKRIQLERTRQETIVKEPRKPKAQPLSKYRRKTANARERYRMKEINEAFATLRGILPGYTPRRPTPAGLTKITTLRMAASYIQALSDVLNDVSPSECRAIHSSHAISSNSSCQEGQKNSSDSSDYCHGSRGSLSSNSDLGDLFSDDSCVFEDNLDAFDDIPSLQEPDPFALLLVGDQVDIALES